MPTEEQTYRAGVKEQLNRIEAKVTYTNGKVRKIIIALTLIAGVIVGQTFTTMKDIIEFIARISS